MNVCRSSEAAVCVPAYAPVRPENGNGSSEIHRADRCIHHGLQNVPANGWRGERSGILSLDFYHAPATSRICVADFYAHAQGSLNGGGVDMAALGG